MEFAVIHHRSPLYYFPVSCCRTVNLSAGGGGDFCPQEVLERFISPILTLLRFFFLLAHVSDEAIGDHFKGMFSVRANGLNIIL